MKDEIIIGTDIGTGSCKAVAVTVSGKVLNETQEFYNTIHPKEGYSELDPEIILHGYIRCIKKLTLQLTQPVIALSISSAMHSLMLMDENNQPLTGLITWEDTRSYPIASQLRGSSLGKKIYKTTGTPLHSMSPLCKISWFNRNKKNLFRRAAKFIGIKEFLWYQLFGVYEVDYSIASATGLFDILNLKWFPPALKFCGITESQLSRPVNTTSIRTNPSADFLQKTRLPESISVCIGASDGCLANLGSQISGKQKASLTIGTSGAIRVTTKKPIVNSETMIFNYLLDAKTFISGGAINNGGNVMKWLIKEFMNKNKPGTQDFISVSKHVSQVPVGSEGILCVPYLHGERAPVWDERAAATWIGVRGYHTKYHLIRAFQEGIAFSLKIILENIEKQNGKISTIYASGGFTNSPEWLHLMADITEKKIIVIEKEDASSVGAAFLAMSALKIKPEKKNEKEEFIILPDTKAAYSYQKLFPIFKKMYPLTNKYIHQLQSLSIQSNKLRISNA